MVHAAVAHARPGDILVLTLPSPEPVALVGDLLATQAKARGVAAVLVDAAIRDLDELGSSVCRSGRAGFGAAAPRSGRRRARRAGRGRRRGDPRRAISSCSTRTVRSSWSRSGSKTSSRGARPSRSRARKAAQLEAGALSYDLDGLRTRRARDASRSTTSPTSATSSCSPRSPTRACGSSSTCSGWRSRRRTVTPSTCAASALPALRPQAHCVDAQRAGPHGAARVEPRGTRAASRGDRAAGLGLGWIDGDLGHGPGLPLHRPGRPVFEIYYEAERYAPPEHLRPRWKNQPQRYVAARCGRQAARPRQPARADVRANRDVRAGRPRLPPLRAGGAGRRDGGRRVDEPHDRGARADLRRGRLGRTRASPPPRVLGRHPRGVLRAADVFVDAGRARSRRRRRSTRSRRASSCTGSSPAETGSRSRTGGYFVYDPDFEPITWTAEERARGQEWGVKTIESFHTYGTPDVGGGGVIRR